MIKDKIPKREYGDMMREFLAMETAGGILLVGATITAMWLANTGFASAYMAFLDIPVAIKFGALEIAKPLLLWINDGLMAVFFFLIGLEIKREFLKGELSSLSQIALPGIGAIGGVVLPAVIYMFINSDSPENMNGWAIPAATDIAFALAVLSLLGDRVPVALKVLLLAIAIFDDLGAILIIAFFYTDQLSLMTLMLGLLPCLGLAWLSWKNVTVPSPYIVLGIILWVLVLKSGIHATLAGVITALAIPMTARAGSSRGLLVELEHGLHPWVAFGILPLFAFSNAGVSFAGVGLESFVEPVKLGISVGLFFGKQFGIFIMLWLAIMLGLARMPSGVNWGQLYGVSVLAGIGFTMSLFIGSLAFEHSNFDAPIRLGVLTGSILSAFLGLAILHFSCPKTPAQIT